MAGETIVLDPTAVATGRTQLDITSYVAAAGPNWGDAEIQAYMADQQVGSTTIDYRLPNRTITIPLNLRTLGATTFSTIRSSLEQKVALMQRQQGQIMRQVGSTPLYADVQSATLHLGGAWLQAYRDVDVDAVLTLECVPDWYGDEITLTTHTETTLPHLFFTEATINGNYPGRVRIIATNGTAIDQHGLLWGLRSRYYNAGTTAQMFYEAEALTPVNGATAVGVAGASGGTVIQIANPPIGPWVSMLNTNMVSGAVPLTHTGSYRVWARLYSSGVNAQFRLVWGNAGLSVPITNDPQVMPNNTAGFFMTDLGPIRIDAPPVGVNQWLGVIQTNAVSSGLVDIDCLYFQPLDEGAGKLTYTNVPPASSIQASAAPATAANDAGTGSATWITGIPNSSVFFSGGTATSQYLKLTGFGLAVPSSATIVGISAAILRWASTIGWITDNRIRLVKAGTVQATDKAASGTWDAPVTILYGGATDLWGTTWAPTDVNNAGFGIAISVTNPYSGPITARLTSMTITVYYILASGFTVAPDAVIAASRTIELRTDGMYRQGAGGTIFAPVSQVTGDLPRIPPSGLESRPVQVFLKASRGEFNQEADTGIDDLSAQLIYRPSFLITP